MSDLVLQDVTVAQGSHTLLEGLSLRFRQGSATALLGPNGVGKSTLLHLCAGLHPCAKGRAMQQERSLHEMTPVELARWRSYLGQRPPVVFDFSVTQAIIMGTYAELGQGFFSPKGALHERCQAALAKVGITHLAERGLGHLSGGELQRVMVARSVMSKAGWWMWDEPTSELDPKHAIETMRLMREHCDDGGSAIVVLHDLNLVAPFFDHVVLLEHGGLLAAGRREEVMTCENLSQAFDTPITEVHDEVWYLGR